MHSVWFGFQISQQQYLVLVYFTVFHDFFFLFLQVTDSNDWNMSHFFHAMLGVTFQQGVSASEARRDADKQLAVRIQDPNLRAWLLMNMMQDEETKEIRWRCNVQGIYDSFQSHIGT